MGGGACCVTAASSPGGGGKSAIVQKGYHAVSKVSDHSQTKMRFETKKLKFAITDGRKRRRQTEQCGNSCFIRPCNNLCF